MMKKLSRLPNKWRKNKIKQSDFTETKKEDCLLPAPVIPLSATYHRSCKTLPLEPFIQAYCNADLSGLIIEGTPEPDKLQYAWNEVMFDYSGLLKSEKSEYLLSLSWEIAALQHHIIYVDYSVIALKYKYNEHLVNGLAEIGYSVPAFEDKNYQAELNRITSLAKSKIFDLGNLTDEYNRLNKTVEGKKQSEDEFIKTVMMLAKYQGYAIDRKITTVFDFVQIFNNYLAEMQVKEKQLEKYVR